MKIFYNNKQLNIIHCNTFIKRLKGLMFYKEKINFGLRFKCNGIHTFFMYQNIDVVLCDKHNKILYYYPEVKKNKVILPKKNVYYTYELPPLYFDIKVGSYITIKKAK